MNWYINVHSKAIRKSVSHVGGYAADYCLTELLCRSGRWCKQYQVVYGYDYHIMFESNRDAIANAGGNVHDDFIKYANKETIGDIFECSAYLMMCGRYLDELWKFMEHVFVVLWSTPARTRRTPRKKRARPSTGPVRGARVRR